MKHIYRGRWANEEKEQNLEAEMPDFRQSRRSSFYTMTS